MVFAGRVRAESLNNSHLFSGCVSLAAREFLVGPHFCWNPLVLDTPPRLLVSYNLLSVLGFQVGLPVTDTLWAVAVMRPILAAEHSLSGKHVYLLGLRRLPLFLLYHVVTRPRQRSGWFLLYTPGHWWRVSPSGYPATLLYPSLLVVHPGPDQALSR